jgi:hypothetical protein
MQEIRILTASSASGLQKQSEDLLSQGWRLMEGVRVGLDGGDPAAMAESYVRGGAGWAPTTVWYATLVRESRTGGV